MVSKIKNKHFNTQIVITNVLMYIVMLLIFLLFYKGLFIFNNNSETTSLALFSSLFAFIVIGLSMSFYIEYKYNQLSFKNIFFYLGIAIAIINIISVSILPNEIKLPYNQVLVITTSTRIYALLYGFGLAILPFLIFYVIPRRILHKKAMILIMKIILGAVLFFVITSLFKEFNSYIFTLKHLFSDSSHPVVSLVNYKNLFAQLLFVGICVTSFLHIYTKKWQWLLCFVPLAFVILFTFAKMPIIISFIYIIVYLLYILINKIKNNKNSMIIFYFVLGFLVIFVSFIVPLIASSQTGILYSIKKVFLNIGESAKATFSSRKIIWDCAFKLLQPVQYIFGASFALFGYMLRATYTPVAPEDPTPILHAHNGFIEILGEGGFIYFFIQITMLALLIYYSLKIYKKNKTLVIFTFLIIFLNLLHSITDPIYFFAEMICLLLTPVIIWPIMSTYYSQNDIKEVVLREDIINASSRNCDFISSFDKLNFKAIKIHSKYIQLDKKETKHI